MDKKEFGFFASAIRTYYPKEQILPNQQAMELWYRELQDIPFAVAEASLRQWVATNKWSPSIAEIRELASTVQSGSIPDWGEGWEQVLMAIRKFGTYRIPEAMESFDPLTRRCVERLGFRNLCMSENPATDRANFRMIYEQLAERQKKESQMSLPLKEIILQIQAKGENYESNKLLETNQET